MIQGASSGLETLTTCRNRFYLNIVWTILRNSHIFCLPYPYYYAFGLLSVFYHIYMTMDMFNQYNAHTVSLNAIPGFSNAVQVIP